MAGRENNPGPGSGKAGGALLLAWLAAALGVPSAVAAVKWRSIGTHPVLGVLLLLVAAVLAAAGGLVRQLWRRKYNDRVVDWISSGLDRRVPRFGRRYRAHLLTELRYIDLRGLAGRFYTPELSEVYVDVAVRPRDPGKVPSSDLPVSGLAGLPEAGQRRLLTDFLDRPQPRVLAVLGAPGSGKTTLLRHTAREICLRRRGQGRRIPVLLYLRDHAEAIIADPKVALPALVGTALDRYGLTEPPGWLDARLRAGDCVVLLDGLDEVARQEDRVAVSEWVGVQVTRYSGNDFVVTSRPLGYQSAPLEAAIVLQTQPFTDEQVSRFLHAWYLAVERHSTGAADSDITRRAGEEADDLLARLRESPALRDLTVNPLLLTMIATVHRHHGALPGSRAELYAQICQVLLWRRQAAKKLAVEPRGPQKERIMRLLAFEMMRRQVRDLTTAEAAAIVRPALRRTGKDLTVTAAGFLDDAASSGLFIERENGVRAFAHLTFQEYLAAAHIKDKNLQDVLAQAAGDPWWRETTLLYVASADAGPIVHACLTADTVPALALAFDCAEEAGELSEVLRGQLEDIRAAGLSHDADPQRRRLMTGVTIARHLRRVIYGDDGARICAQPITTGIYQYFLEDMAAHGQHMLPDIPPGSRGAIATGARGSDAAIFVEWLNDITGGQPSYRLPTRAEIQDQAVHDALSSQFDLQTHGIWLAPGESGKMPQLLPPGSFHFPLTISGDSIKQKFEAEFHESPIVWGLLPLITRISITDDDVQKVEPTFALRIDRDNARALIDVIILALDVRTSDFAENRDLDAARVIAAYLFCVRNLARALDYARGITRDSYGDSGSARDVALARDLDLALARVRDSARGLAVARDNALSLARDLENPSGAASDVADAVALARDHDHDHSLARALDKARSLALDLDFASDVALAREHTRHLVLALDLDKALALDRDLDNTLVSALAHALDHVRAHVRVLDNTRKRDLDRDLAYALILGAASSTYLGHTLSKEPSAVFSVAARIRLAKSDLRSMVAARLCDVSGIGNREYLVSPELLGEVINSTLRETKKLLEGSDLSSAKWVSQVIANFGTLTEGFLAREQLVTTSIAFACRTIALCLAAEASYADSPDLNARFRQIAATITWLERRHSGDDPSREIILLALN